MDRELPRVLVPSISVWQDKGTARTLPELFSCWDNERIAQIYTKADIPHTTVCKRFFRINENAVMKSIFRRSVKTSAVVENSPDEDGGEESAELLAEKKLYGREHRFRWLLRLMREFVWLLGKWKTPELDRFISDFDPELLFVTIYPVVYMARLQRYIIKRTKLPVVCYLFDDNYSYKVCAGNPIAYIHRAWLRRNVKKLIKAADKLYVISPMQKEECDRLFGTNSEILTRFIDENGIDKSEQKPHDPIRMIYTGKLGNGRDEAIKRVAEAVADINGTAGRERITFSIYSGDTPVKKYREYYDRGSNKFCGSVASDKISVLQKESDICLFAESLNRKHRYSARLSFSTKLTDYLSSGKCIFAVGDRGIAPIDYLIREACAVVVTDYDDIKPALLRLCDDRELIAEYGKRAISCGLKNHRKDEVLTNFKSAMCGVYDAYNLEVPSVRA